jgi:pimeloyl-ACP methyl ester carboxylesterase
MASSLAHHFTPGTGPTLVFLCGYASDMAGTKALALEAWARERGRGFLRFDYSGCGASPGRFEDQTLSTWRDDAVAMIDGIEGPVVLAGSSMGGWVMLLAALARPDRVVGLVGVAAAPDFTGWGFSDAQKAELREAGRLEEPSLYSDDVMVTTLAFWESGEASRVMDGAITIDVPVRLIQGQQDAEVPWERAAMLAGQLRSSDVQTWLVKDGDHRLSRPPDIALIVRAIEDVS